MKADASKYTINSEPWNQPFSTRIQRLKKNTSKKNVVYLYERPDTTTFRYRVYNMCQALEYSDRWNGSFFFEQELDQLRRYLQDIDVVIISRMRWTPIIGNVLTCLRKEEIPVCFDTDDLVISIEHIPLLMNTLNVDFAEQANIDSWFASVSRAWYVGSQCQNTIGTNDFLCGRLKEVFGTLSYAICNFLNNEQITVSKKLYEAKKSVGRKKSPFTIGYFSGTPSHANDFRKVAVELGALLETYSEITLRVVGYMEFPEILKKHIKSGRVVSHPLVDFLTLQKAMADVDVSIVPLIDNEFTNCKSELKYFEAAIVGTVTCATPTYTYRTSIQHEKTGFLCREGEWFSTIERLYLNGIDPSIARLAQETCLKTYTPKEQTKTIEAVLDAVA